MKSRVFLSYAHEDRVFAHQISSVLANRGFSVWSDSSIPMGENWNDAIKKALRQANIFIPIVSKSYLNSDFAIAELGGAYGLKKQILPIRLSADIHKMPFNIADIQMLDARKMDMESLVNSIETEALALAA